MFQFYGMEKGHQSFDTTVKFIFGDVVGRNDIQSLLQRFINHLGDA